MPLNYIKVALPLNIDELTYSIDHENPKKLIGSRVLVSIGKKTIQGVITDTDSEKSSFKVKPIIKLIDSSPIFSEHLMDFIKWLAKYYMSPLGETINAALPSGFLTGKRTILKFNEIDPQQILTYSGYKLKLLQYLSSVKKASLKNAEKKVGAKSLSKQAKELREDGLIEISEQDKSNSGFVFEKYIKFNYEIFSDLREDLKSLKIRSKKQISVIEFFLSNRSLFDTEISRSYLIENTGADSQSLKKLEEKKIIEIILKKRDRSLSKIDVNRKVKNELLLEPNSEQKQAINLINEKIETGDPKPIALFGVTGSGKTLVYINCAKKALDLGKDVLLILPEIALTNHLLDRFEIAFPENVYLYHSRLDAGTKHDIFFNIKNDKKPKVIIGTRSAIFAPSDKLGLVIIDEEHDQSLKQMNPSPRYHARDSAIMRSKFEKSAIVLGTATPSLETWDNSVEERFDTVWLNKRAENAAMPKIYLVDQLDAKKAAAVKGIFSLLLLDKIYDRISKGEQVILFINRRGYSSFLECTNCGEIPMCKNCDVALTYHSNGQLKCHICNYNYKTNLQCYSCGKEKLTKLGMGTQKIEEDLEQIFAESGIEIKYKRVDGDTISNSKKLDSEIRKFIDKEYDVLIGTQLISKGLDIENVTLVGVVNSDLELYRNDFRANERTYQMIKQVAGRAGRSKDKPGEVVIQSNHPDNYALSLIQDESIEKFYNLELNKRKKAAFPPLVRFCTVTFEGKNEERLDSFAKQIFKKMNVQNSFATIFEPVVPTLSKVNEYFRRMIVIKDFKQMDGSGRKVRKLIQDALDSTNNSSIKISIDIDSYLSL